MVLKRDITPLSKKGHVIIHKGKGSVQQRLRPGEAESVTGPPRFTPTTHYPTLLTPPSSTAGAALPPSPVPMMGHGEPDADDLG